MTESPSTELEAAIYIRPEDLDDLLTRAAERAAQRCLARHTARQTIIEVATTQFLNVIQVVAAIKLKPKGGAPLSHCPKTVSPRLMRASAMAWPSDARSNTRSASGGRPKRNSVVVPAFGPVGALHRPSRLGLAQG